MTHFIPELKPLLTPGASASSTAPGAWRLQIPAGPAGAYRVAQLDDYAHLSRHHFPWRADSDRAIQLSLEARLSTPNLSGTWGFGWWNDPFSLSLGMGGGSRRFPALPQAAWFFFASPPNYLSFRNDLPAQGFLAATFRSFTLSAPLLALASLLLPLALVPLAARLFRRIARKFIQQDAALIELPQPVTEWHRYTLHCSSARVQLAVDDRLWLETSQVPRGPLGLVLWVDNQYAGLPPGGRLKFGYLSNPSPAWLEIANLRTRVE